MKKLILASLIISPLLISNPAFSETEQKANHLYKDVSKDHWAYKSLEKLINKYGLKIGFPDNTFRGEKLASRYEVAVLLTKVLDSLNKNKIEIEVNEITTLDDLKEYYSKDIENIYENLSILNDKTDIHDTLINKNSENIDILSKFTNFRLFGSLALRNCFMSSNIFSDPANIFNNMQGNMFQARVGAGISGTFASEFDYQLRILSIANNSFNLPWMSVQPDNLRVPFYFDRFSISYNPTLLNNSNNNLSFTFGKSFNFIPETQLLFDEDISFMGLQQMYTRTNNSFLKEFFIGFSENFLLNEGTFNTVYMLSGKTGIEVEPIKDFSIKTGTSYTHYIGSNNFAKYTFHQGYMGSTSVLNRKNGNNFSSNFNLLDVFLKLKYNLTDSLPLEIYGDFINNFGSTDKNKGYMIGAKFGSLDKTGDYFINYNYKLLEQDYNLSFFVMDQMGGTDVLGHEIDFGFKIAPKTSIFFEFQHRKSISFPDNSNLYILYSNIRQDF